MKLEKLEKPLKPTFWKTGKNEKPEKHETFCELNILMNNPLKGTFCEFYIFRNQHLKPTFWKTMETMKNVKNMKNLKKPCNQHFVNFTSFEINT